MASALMTTGAAEHQPRGAEAVEATRPSRSRRLAVERILPAEIIAALRQEVEHAPKLDASLARDLDRRFRIEEQHCISRRRLLSFMKRLKEASGSDHTSPAADNGAVPGVEWGQKLKAQRRRQASVAKILDSTFGKLAACSPELWGRRAYLMILGLVYERLATNEDDISTEELVALAKVLAEQRRADASSSAAEEPARQSQPDRPKSQELPENFSEIVRQVYGTNFHAPTKQ